MPRILVDETELRDRAGAGNTDRRHTFDCAGGVIDCLVRHIAVARIGTVVAAATPYQAEPRGDKLIAFFDAGALDAAQHIEIASGEHLSEPPGVHSAGYRKPDLRVGPCSRLPTC